MPYLKKMINYNFETAQSGVNAESQANSGKTLPHLHILEKNTVVKYNCACVKVKMRPTDLQDAAPI